MNDRQLLTKYLIRKRENNMLRYLDVKTNYCKLKNFEILEMKNEKHKISLGIGEFLKYHWKH